MEFGPPARIVGTAGSRVVGLTWTSTSESSSVANALVVTTAMNVRVFDVVHGSGEPNCVHDGWALRPGGGTEFTAAAVQHVHSRRVVAATNGSTLVSWAGKAESLQGCARHRCSAAVAALRRAPLMSQAVVVVLVDGAVALHDEVTLTALAAVSAAVSGAGAVSWVSHLARSSLGDHCVLLLRARGAGARSAADAGAELCVFSIAAGVTAKERGGGGGGGGGIVGTPVGDACVDFCGRHVLRAPSGDSSDTVAAAAFHPLDFSLSVVWATGAWQVFAFARVAAWYSAAPIVRLALQLGGACRVGRVLTDAVVAAGSAGRARSGSVDVRAPLVEGRTCAATSVGQHPCLLLAARGGGVDVDSVVADSGEDEGARGKLARIGSPTGRAAGGGQRLDGVFVALWDVRHGVALATATLPVSCGVAVLLASVSGDESAVAFATTEGVCVAAFHASARRGATLARAMGCAASTAELLAAPPRAPACSVVPLPLDLLEESGAVGAVGAATWAAAVKRAEGEHAAALAALAAASSAGDAAALDAAVAAHLQSCAAAGAAPVSAHYMASAVVACLDVCGASAGPLPRGLWRGLRRLMRTRRLAATACPALLPFICGRREVALVEAYTMYAQDVPEAELVAIFQFVLTLSAVELAAFAESNLRVSAAHAGDSAAGDVAVAPARGKKRGRSSNGGVEDAGNGGGGGPSPAVERAARAATVTHFVSLIICAPRNDLFLERALRALASPEVALLLAVMLQLLVSAELPPSAPVTDEGASAVAALPAAGAVSFKPAVPALKELLDWIRIVTDGHFPVLVLCAGSSAVLQTLLGQLRELVGQQIVLCEGLRTVHGQLAHFGSADPLPAVQPLAEYGLETLLF